ncbi:hypothetical protein C2S51_022073 [Perilla frutescens var. frutescens]|nr:hypothetical protein C2S51_022073 [Perilla frutescens var. frutescens]
MDMADTNREPTEDSTRESLIALSYGVPETEQPAAMSPKNTSDEKTVETLPGNGDGEEKYRSKLISISSSPSPDMKVQPMLPVELDG